MSSVIEHYWLAAEGFYLTTEAEELLILELETVAAPGNLWIEEDEENTEGWSGDG